MSNALFVAWRAGGQTNGQWGPVGRLEHGPSGYRFLYTQGARNLVGFSPFPGMEDLDAIYESSELFPLFANRLLARSRPEYEAFLTWSGFNPAETPDPIAILAVTEGRRATDSLEVFPCPAPNHEGQYVNKFFLHGVQWMPAAALERIATLRSSESLGLMLDDMNQYDRYAVAVRTCDVRNRFMIGYVPRYLAREFRKLGAMPEAKPIELVVERVNRDAPVQQRVLCRMSATWPEGFRPCESVEFDPISSELMTS